MKPWAKLALLVVAYLALGHILTRGLDAFPTAAKLLGAVVAVALLVTVYASIHHEPRPPNGNSKDEGPRG